MLEVEPENTMALLFRAQAHAHWKKDPSAALSDAERAMELDPDLVEAYEPRILALLALDRQSEARGVLEEAGERLAELGATSGRLAWHCSTTATFASEGGGSEEAREIWEDCLERYPSDPSVVTNAVHFFDANGETQRSLAVLQRALEETPSQRLYRTGVADRLRAVGRAAEGEALLLEATEVADPRLAALAWTDVAKLRHSLGEHAGAATALAHAIDRVREVEEPSPQILFQYADALLVSGQLERALEVADEIPVEAQRRLIRARVAQERGEWRIAMEHFDEALRIWPDNPWARYYTALVAEKLGDFDRALEEYRYSIRISVGATDARTHAARLLIAEGQPVLAYQLLFLEADSHPLEPEGELLSMYLMGRVANPTQLQTSLASLGARDPARLPEALARGAEGAAAAAGPGAALNLLSGAPGADYTDPAALPALEALVRQAIAADRPESASRVVEAALAAHPESADFHWIRGLQLELEGAAPERVWAAYSRAVELDPHQARALEGLGRLMLSRDPEAALGFFDRAAASDPDDVAASLGAARALITIDRGEEAARRLESLLEDAPLESEAAAELAALDLARGVVREVTLDAARRAARFGGGPEDHERLRDVYLALDRPDEAEEAAGRARLIRERRVGPVRDSEMDE